MLMAFISGIFPGVGDWPYYANVQMFFLTWGVMTSLCGMAAISFVKLLAVVRPLHFQQDVIPKRCRYGLIAMWSLTFVMSLPYLTKYLEIVFIEPLLLPVTTGNGYIIDQIVCLCVYLPVGTTIFFSYGKICLVILKQKRAVTVVGVQVNGNANSQSVLSAIKSARKIFVIIIVYCLVYTPASVSSSLGYISDPATQNEWYCFFAQWLLLSNCFINNVLYIAMYSETRAAVRKMLLCQSSPGGDTVLSE